ncbi:MAG: ribosome biogenesis GTPase Der [Bacilli bacterium]|nr:ribosome biogenesis GTPase Der [Bacilli bacterium]
MKYCVCLIGRPNVGKSTLFNLLIKEKKSIILDTPGITRDRIYGNLTYNNKNILLIDTGGIDLEDSDFNKDIKAQGEIAIEEANVIIFVVDGKEELNPNDYLIRDMLRKTNKKVIIAANKLDNKKLIEENIYKFYELGFENVVAISAIQNSGINELLDLVTSDFKASEDTIEDDSIKFSLIGRPNVGKSSLINALLNKERSIVSDVAGTTRDSIDTKFKYNNQEFTVIDTAGMRKKGKIFESVEKYSLIRSLKAIDRSDVCCLVINAEEGIIEHDKHIMSYAIDAGKAVVIIVNKWDKIDNPNQAIKEWKEKIKYNFQFCPYAKVVFTSAKTKKRLTTLMPEIIAAYENTTKEIKTNLLNDVIREANMLHQAPSYKGKRLKIYFVSQTSIKPPEFTFNVNNKGLVHFSYERYLENKIREAFDLEGTPIIIKFKNKKDE